MKNMKENSLLLGGNTMKKTFVVLASAALLVFAFAAVAGAKYAGYAKDGSATVQGTGTSAVVVNSTTPGYLSWGGAQSIMNINYGGNAPSFAGTAHGGYVTTTTKCAVCHSAHRATGIGVIASVAPTANNTAAGVVNQFLTNAGDSCVQCHTTWGATPAALLIEWGNTSPTAGGPHSSAHAATATDACSNCHQGGIHGSGSSIYWGMNAFMLGGNNDTQITNELAQQEASTASGALAATNWFFNGGTYTTAIGGMPTGTTASTYAVARSMLTGYTCSQSGCHTNSVFANATWGQTYTRADAVTGADVQMTGHATSMSNGAHAANSSQAGCGPCHPGNSAGGYRFTAGVAAPSARQYGCDQCHDMVGVATNSTAFPHGNQNIEVYQWDNTGAISTATVGRGNIWMYQSNMAATSNSTAVPLPTIDKSFQVIQDAVPGSGNTRDPGNIVDGVCLKCHVAYDSTSAQAMTGSATTLLSATNHGRPSPTPTNINSIAFKSTSFLYTWR